MRRLKFVTLALSGSALLSAGAAHAQFGGIVHDPTAFARQLQELNEARKVVQQSAQQLDEARALYRSEEHTSELQSLMRISYAVFCLKKKNRTHSSSYINKYNI